MVNNNFEQNQIKDETKACDRTDVKPNRTQTFCNKISLPPTIIENTEKKKVTVV